MSYKGEFEERIRSSFGLIREFEQIRQLTDSPKEKRRAELGIAEQRELIKGYLTEYLPLCQQLGVPVEGDILEIAVVTGFPLPSSTQSPSAVSAQSAQSLPSNTPPTQACYALVIGVAAYRYIRPLAKTTADAQDLHQILRWQGYPEANTTLLLDGHATKSAISEKLDWLARRVSPEDTAIVFFSGHGMQLVGGFWPGAYLCPVEASLDKVKDTFIASDEFTLALQAIRARRLVVFLDACHAGGVGEPKDMAVRVKLGLSEAAYNELAAGQGRVLITSCRPDEVSYEFPGMRNGLFTHYLLEGLRGGAARQDGTIWISGLFGYVYQHVSQHNVQHPFQKSAAEDFVIARVPPT